MLARSADKTSGPHSQNACLPAPVRQAHARGDAQKKNPASAVCNSSFELLETGRDPSGCFRLPVKACRLQPQLKPLGFSTTVQGHSF